MSDRRINVGKRNDGTYGIFVARPGFDAFTTADANLVLNIQSKVSQLLMLGHVASTQTISLGLSRSPMVLVTSKNTLASVPGHVGSGGPTRPSPLGNGFPFSSATINGNGVSLTVSCSVDTTYAVYSTPFT
jgi:hypothetical protein